MEAPGQVRVNSSSDEAEQVTSDETGSVSQGEECLQDFLPSSIQKAEDGSPTDSGCCSFVEAVKEKYNYAAEGSTAIDGLYLPKYKPVELTESGTILLPRQLSMSGYNIGFAGDAEVIKSMCQKVEELDLMANNIQSWEEVFSILEGTPELDFLNLSQNKINPSSSLPDICSCNLPNLKRLVLNDTKVTWDVLLRFLEHFPHIEELHLSVNNYTRFDVPDNTPAYKSLKSLLFVGNSITDWQDINRIGVLFPSLEFFMLSETNVARLTGEDQIPTSFPCLKSLGLNRTRLESWDEVEKLRKFPQLTDIRLRYIPFLDSQPKDVLRNHTIALLPGIKRLNQTPISENEREDAERAYIRLYMDQEPRPARYHELENIHGKLHPLPPLSLKPKTTVTVIIKVEELDDDNAMRLASQEKEMEIDVKMTVKDLRKLLSNELKHPSTKLQLHHVDKDMGMNWSTRMNYPNMNILGYKVKDGDEIIAVKWPLEEGK